MEEKKSFCCRALPKVLWWFLALFGLVLIYLFMLKNHKDPIEADLSQRVSGSLTGEGIPWAKVDIDERGRDILLSGDAPSEDAKNKAISLAQSVYGVRVVDNNIVVGAGNEPAAAKNTDTAPQPVAAVEEAATAVVSEPEPVKVEEPTEALTLDIAIDEAGKMVLTGEVSSQEELDAILKAATKRVGEGNVINNLTVNNAVKPSAWLTALPELMGLVTAGGSISVNADGVKYTGSVESQDMMSQILDKAKSLLSAFNIPVLNNLIVDNVAVASEKVAMVMSEEPASPAKEAEASVPEEKAVEPPKVEVSTEAINVCQNKLNDSTSDKTILFRTNTATIQQNSYPLLDAVSSVMQECKKEISANGVSINGHTDSLGDEAYNMSLSLRRANAVRDYLVGKGVDSALLKAVGHGETNPVADNNTPEGRAQNRRITFIIKQN